ncbi:MAG: hypothetical protein DU429_00240 [Candidatus Tokpelaia sp.]|nr:MAG: hypothetical protein DU430_04185 [Candidatus Tokpelaia sp.]KAA6207540.1 MAG: hypothetical protein DU429_00240 [Candidatus Tokpelaia sp.]KAA6404709.1 hypothetical protein DPQ22_07170 [Candidatus Tokpelaia sp.]
MSQKACNKAGKQNKTVLPAAESGSWCGAGLKCGLNDRLPIQIKQICKAIRLNERSGAEK